MSKIESSDGREQASFNLLDRPWIPVSMKNGSDGEVSLRELFYQAQGIARISTGNPIQDAAILRVAVGVLYGVFGNDCPQHQWNQILKLGPSDTAIWNLFEQYFDRYRERFDLFDERAPFYQVAGLHTTKNEFAGLEKIVSDIPSNEGSRLFSIRGVQSLKHMSAAEAARWLVSTQAFDPSGIKSGAVGDPRVKGGKGYPLGIAWSGHLGIVIAEGDNLWKTLMFQYVGRDVLGTSEPDVDWSDDSPIWERPITNERPEEGYNQPEDATGIASYCHGPATLLTWQSRRVLFQHDGEVVTGVLLCNGDRLKPQNAQGYEMMTAWRRSPNQEKTLKMPLVYMPRKHDPSRALWRNLPMLTVPQEEHETNTTPENMRPRILDWLEQMHVQDQQIRLHAYGVVYGNNDAVIDAIVDDSLDLNLCILTAEDPRVGQSITDAINITDEGITILANFAGNVAKSAGLDPTAPRRKARELAYSTFDREFREWLRDVTIDNCEAKLREWRRRTRETLLALEFELAQQASTRAIVGRDVKENPEAEAKRYSVALAEIWFKASLNKRIPKEEM